MYQWVLAVCTFLLNRFNYNTIVQDFFQYHLVFINIKPFVCFFSIFTQILLVYSLTVCLLIICLNSLIPMHHPKKQQKKIIKNALLQITEYGLMNNYLFRFSFFVGHKLMLIWTLWWHCWNHRKVTELKKNDYSVANKQFLNKIKFLTTWFSLGCFVSFMLFILLSK